MERGNRFEPDGMGGWLVIGGGMATKRTDTDHVMPSTLAHSTITFQFKTHSRISRVGATAKRPMPRRKGL